MELTLRQIKLIMMIVGVLTTFGIPAIVTTIMYAIIKKDEEDNEF